MTDQEIRHLYRLTGERVKLARERAGLSQSTLAREIGLSRVSMVNIEKGRQRPPLHVMWTIAIRLGVEPAHLLPRRVEHVEATSNVDLPKESLARIKEATKGDPRSQARLTQFVQNAKQQT